MTDWKVRHRRHMRGFLVGFLLAAAGAGLAFILDSEYGPHNPWSYVAAALGLAGIGIAGHHVMQGRAIALAEFRKMDREAAERRAARRRALKSE